MGGKDVKSSFGNTDLEVPGGQPSGEEQKVGLRAGGTLLAGMYTDLRILAQDCNWSHEMDGLAQGEGVQGKRTPEEHNTECIGGVCCLEMKGGEDSGIAVLMEWGLKSAF